MLLNDRTWLLMFDLETYLKDFTTLVISRNSSDFLYIFGGYDGNYDSDQVWLYDSIRLTLQTALTRALSSHYTLLNGDHIIHYGGSYKYDGFAIDAVFFGGSKLLYKIWTV